jgi:hypothetical protein
VASTTPYVRRWDPETRETYYEHQAVAEQKLGRPLEPGEVVHHDDGNKQHNHPSSIFTVIASCVQSRLMQISASSEA